MIRFCLIVILFFVSCEAIKYRRLEDKITKIPSDKFFFDKNYRNKYAILSPSKIDTNAIYIENCYVSSDGKIFSSKDGLNSFINGIKFYGNGCINSFSLDKNKLNNIIDLNPSVSGYRGICYKSKNDTLVEIIVPIDENYNLGRKKYTMRMSKDTLFLENKEASSKYIYLKSKLEGNNIQYKSNW
jgi:hypothetical protein